MKITLPFLLLVCAWIFISPKSEAALDIPLKWKAQEWQFVVIVQAGGQITNSTNYFHVQTEKKIIKILRGTPDELPKFEAWQFNDLKKDHYYLINYWNYKAPYQGARWENLLHDVVATNDSFIIKGIQDNQTNGFYDGWLTYQDMPLSDFEKLLAETPYEPNPTNTIIFQNSHRKK